MPDWILNSKLLTILATVVCGVVIIAFVLGYVGEGIMLTILGFVGFTGIATFRDWINSQGWKTYVVVGLGFIGTIAMAVGWITLDAFIAILTLLGVGSAGTLTVALKKAPTGDKLKTIKIAA